MFLKKKKEEKKEAQKNEILRLENIKVGCAEDTKENVIRQVGQMLVDSGYVDQPYVEAMLEREQSFSTFMGSGLALPHGVEAAKKEIKASGIAVMTFPEGTKWGDEVAKIVIGIAGVGDEHLQILATIADKILVPEIAEEIIQGDEETIYRILGGKE